MKRKSTAAPEKKSARAASQRALAKALKKSQPVINRWIRDPRWPFKKSGPWDIAKVRDWARKTLSPDFQAASRAPASPSRSPRAGRKKQAVRPDGGAATTAGKARLGAAAGDAHADRQAQKRGAPAEPDEAGRASQPAGAAPEDNDEQLGEAEGTSTTLADGRGGGDDEFDWAEERRVNIALKKRRSKKLQLEIEKLRATHIPLAEAIDAWARIGHEMKTNFLNLPESVVPALQGLSESDQREVLRERLREVLKLMSEWPASKK